MNVDVLPGAASEFALVVLVVAEFVAAAAVVGVVVAAVMFAYLAAVGLIPRRQLLRLVMEPVQY